ncbi:MAG: ATP-binding protein, partial [bacterium]
LAVDFLESGRTLSLECRDSGPGFPPPLLEQLLDGQITPPVKLGTGGYGLYLIKEVVSRLQGSMLFSNLEPSGARVQVLLPNEKVPDAPHLQAEAPAAARKPFEVIRPDDAHIYPYLVGGFLHDSLNTLGALQHQASGLAKLANGTPEPDALQHVATQLDMYLEHLNRVMKLLQAVSQEYYAKDPSAAHQPKEHVEEQLKNLHATYPAVRFHASLPPSFNETHLPVGILAFVTGELLTNAARACDVAGEGEVSLAVDFLESGRTLSLECRDPGPGFPPPLLEQLLDGQITPPDESGKGGYGLYLIKEIKNRLQGSMLFSNLEPSGARVQVLLPVKGLNR